MVEIGINEISDIQKSAFTGGLSPVCKREQFLDGLISTGKLKYKRYLGSPLRYAGGKSLAVGIIAELIPSGVERIVSPFIGGGSFEIACANELELDVYGYDIFDILCHYWQIQIDSPESLADKLAKFTPNRDTYKSVNERLKKHWKGETRLNGVNLASLFYFSHNMSYGPHFLGSPSDMYLNNVRYDRLLEKVRNFNAPNLHVECMGFEESIAMHTDDFLYCDPPYYLDEGKTFVGMYPHRNFPIHHKGFKHEKLRDLLLGHKGGFILSYNDCPTIREWYSDCQMSFPEWQYTFGQGDTRIGKNREELNNGSHVKKSHELLIWNLP